MIKRKCNTDLKMIKKTTLLFIILFFVKGLSAQDKHFTQFYASPLTLNPALTGGFDGKFRVGGIYRDQWRAALEKPFTTFAGSLEISFPLQLFSNVYKDRAAVGLLFYTDDINGIDFTTNQMAVSGAFHKSLDVESRQFFTIGFQMGLGNRSVNYENLFFEDQFNGVDGYTLATDEDLPENNFSFSDFSVGLNYTITPRKGLSIFAGAALHHIFEPEFSFYARQGNEFIEPESSKIYQKYSGQFSAQIQLADRLQLLPRFLFALQGPHLEMNAGTNFRYLLTDYNSTAVHFGAWVRPVTNEKNGFFLDALVLMAGLEYNNILVGLSYDANLSDFSVNGQTRGAIEVSVAYLGNYENETVLCPKF